MGTSLEGLDYEHMCWSGVEFPGKSDEAGEVRLDWGTYSDSTRV